MSVLSDQSVFSSPESRVLLRTLTEDDVNEEYLGWFLDPVVHEFSDAGVRDMTRQEVVDYMARGKATGTYDMYAVVRKDTNAHIGNVKMGPIDHHHRVSDLSIFIGDRGSWGQGLATEAIEIGTKMAFEAYGMRKVSGPIVSTNVGSIRAYTKAGWEIEGVLVGHFNFHGEVQGQVIVSCFNPQDFELREGKRIPKHGGSS